MLFKWKFVGYAEFILYVYKKYWGYMRLGFINTAIKMCFQILAKCDLIIILVLYSLMVVVIFESIYYVLIISNKKLFRQL